VRAWTEALTEPLSVEDQVPQAMPDASPTRWHRAHTSWFFETFLLLPHLEGYRSPDPAYAHLFNSYYNSLGDPFYRPHRGLITRPTVAEVTAYRRQVDEGMTALLEKVPEEIFETLLPLLEIGLQHEQQHQELILTDLKNLLARNPLQPTYRPETSTPADATQPALRWHDFEGGLVEIGHGGEGFAFDNEGPRHRVYLEPFRMASRPVTQGEYLEFIADGGYTRPELWLSDGWAVVQEKGWQAPLYQRRDGDAWTLFTLAGRREVRPHEPVCHLSFYEADAYARWAGARLPLEAEWEVAAEHLLGGESGEVDPTATFAEEEVFHPRPAHPEGKGQFLGEVWEWTRSAYSPYPGYAPPEGALGEYNAKFMSGQMVLRGGSCVTPRSHIRTTYRNFFHPGARWQFSGLRLALDGAE
jgi:ergothioneine biosynthesis protein EgtB